MLIPLNKLTDGIIRGEDIPVEKGYYKYLGNISIDKNKIQVNLLIDNTDKKQLNLKIGMANII